MNFELEHALLRGRYMRAAAQIELHGIPIDMAALRELKENWSDIQDELIRRIDLDYGVYDGRTFKVERFSKYLQNRDLAWPYLPSGALDLKEDTFRQMSKMHPDILPLHELRYAMSQLRLSDLAVGSDGRNRTMLSAFRARTGRNQPSNSKFIFGPAVWLRGLIRPHEGRALAIHRLVTAGIWNRSGALEGREDDGGIHLRRSVPGLREASSRRSCRCHEKEPQFDSGTI